MNIRRNIEKFIENHLVDSEHFLVEVEQKGTERFPKLFIYIDGDKVVTVNDCASVAKAVNNFIEEEEVIKTEYGIDVSSPGIDRPLLKNRQYVSNIGRNVKVSLKNDVDKEGKLVSVTENDIELEIKKNKNVVNEKIEFINIDKTKVLITF